ncbi:hypothetical protein SMJ63A_50080 [Stenotrophomonas geniculata]
MKWKAATIDLADMLLQVSISRTRRCNNKTIKLWSERLCTLNFAIYLTGSQSL